jgi:hypothetical protein
MLYDDTYEQFKNGTETAASTGNGRHFAENFSVHVTWHTSGLVDYVEFEFKLNNETINFGK